MSKQADAMEMLEEVMTQNLAGRSLAWLQKYICSHSLCKFLFHCAGMCEFLYRFLIVL
jgi:hypothetical protein